MIENELYSTKHFCVDNSSFSLFDLILYQYIVIKKKKPTICRYELDRR